MPGIHHEFSPSSLAMYEACPGSWRLNKDIPEEVTEFIVEGTMLHGVMAGDETQSLTNEQAEAIEFCRNVFRRERDRLFEEYGEYPVCKSEQMLRLLGDDGSEITFGTADVCMVSSDAGCVIDWKFGRGSVQRAEENLQLSVYMAALMQKNDLRVCRGLIVQPRLGSVSEVVYERQDLLPAVPKTVANIIRLCKEPDAKCLPGDEQCKYCKARLTCPALNQEMSAMEASPLIEKKHELPALPDMALSELYRRSLLVSDFCKDIADEMKKRCVAMGTCGDYELKETGAGFDMPSAQRVYELVEGVMSPDEFTAACTVTMTRLQDAFADAATEKGIVPTKKAAKEMLRDIFREELTPKPPRQTIVRRK